MLNTNREKTALFLYSVQFFSCFSVDKDTSMVGSYGPKTELQSFTTKVEQAPSGMIARGTYTVKSTFTDDDKNNHLQWEWTLEIKKEWP